MTKLEKAQKIIKIFPSYDMGFISVPITFEACLLVAKKYKNLWAGGPYFGEAVSAVFDIENL